ncbi:hypothetical protein EBS02_01630 [bacterium]|nr:hypothetical protein [bacterium]
MKYLLTFPVFEQSPDSPLNISPGASFKKNLQDERLYGNLKGKCVKEEIWPFVFYVLGNKSELSKQLKVDSKTLGDLTKASVGIIGKESLFGKYTTQKDEFILSQKENPGLISSAIDSISSKLDKKPSLGMAQFQEETWKKHNLDKRVGSFASSAKDAKLQGLAVLYSLFDRYQMALKNGLQKQPSKNQILEKYGLIQKINGTGNNALDLSILGHNWGNDVITKWCETSHPLFAAPVSALVGQQKEFQPFKTEESFKNWAANSSLMQKVKDPNLKKFPGKLQAFPDKIIPNYFPNLTGGSDWRSGGGKRTSIGYLEGVCTFMKDLACLDEKFNS